MALVKEWIVKIRRDRNENFEVSSIDVSGNMKVFADGRRFIQWAPYVYIRELISLQLTRGDAWFLVCGQLLNADNMPCKNTAQTHSIQFRLGTVTVHHTQLHARVRQMARKSLQFKHTFGS